MHVEDHPVDYGEFEGVIPSGYGAGIVMLWDKGTWTPEVDDVDAALKKGDLKFTLDGFKLKGSWVIVRTSGGRWGGGKPGDARSWLLIKHRDEWAGDVDIAEFAPLSVKSKGDFADILSEGNPEIWHSHRPAEGGEAGPMFSRIIARALEMRAGGATKTAATKTTATKTAATKAAATKTKATKAQGAARTTAATKTGVTKTAATKRAATKRVAAKTKATNRATPKTKRSS
jgi:bifunctional non-homologous end joining protein LigD